MLSLARLRDRVREMPGAFAVITTDGRTLTVPHQDFVTFNHGLVVIIHPDDSQSLIDPLHIVSLEVHSAAPFNAPSPITSE